MPYVCIITVSQDPRIWDGGRKQVSWPIYSGVEGFLTWLRERTEFLSLGRWFN